MAPSITPIVMRKRLNVIMRNAIYGLVVSSHQQAFASPTANREAVKLSLAGVIRGVGFTSLRSINPNSGDDFAMLWDVSLTVAADILSPKVA